MRIRFLPGEVEPDRVVDSYRADLVNIRRELHAHPETGFQEVRTAARIASELRSYGVAVHEHIAGTGVIGVVQGAEGGGAISLRADMDALPIVEQNTFAHRSVHPGVMHACGHDGHTAMLLGAARYLAEHRTFKGTVNLIFQPAEENLGGAARMVADGLFERFPCDAIFGLHVRPGYPAGRFSICDGVMFAASDEWKVVFRGSGGHGGSMPQNSTDPTLPLAHFIVGLHSIVSRNVAPQAAAVLSVGTVNASGAPNIIPADATVCGTARTHDESVRKVICDRLAALAHHSAIAYGCVAEVSFESRYPAVVNTHREFSAATRAAASVAGSENVDTQMVARTASDDFSFLLQHRPGAFMMIGNGLNEDGTFHGVHTPLFDFNDDVLTSGVKYWVELVFQR